jgi:hypothetical protein
MEQVSAKILSSILYFSRFLIFFSDAVFGEIELWISKKFRATF